MLFAIAAAFVLAATLTMPSVLGQTSVSCYYCQVSYIPGNIGTLPQYFGYDNGCGSPMNFTGSGVLTVACRGICVTQMTYDGSGKQSGLVSKYFLVCLKIFIACFDVFLSSLEGI